MKKIILLLSIVILTSFQTKYIQSEKTVTITLTATQAQQVQYYLLKSVPPTGLTVEQTNTILNLLLVPIQTQLSDTTKKK